MKIRRVTIEVEVLSTVTAATVLQLVARALTVSAVVTIHQEQIVLDEVSHNETIGSHP